MFSPYAHDGTINFLALMPLISAFVQWSKGFIEYKLTPNTSLHDVVLRGYTMALCLAVVLVLASVGPHIVDAKGWTTYALQGVALALLTMGFYHAINPSPQSPTDASLARLQAQIGLTAAAQREEPNH